MSIQGTTGVIRTTSYFKHPSLGWGFLNPRTLFPDLMDFDLCTGWTVDGFLSLAAFETP